MAFTEDGNEGDLNSVTEVEIVPAPASGVRRLVKTITVHNPRTNGSVQLTLQKKNNPGTLGTIFSALLDPGDTFIFGDIGEVEILTGTQNIIAFLDAIPLTQPSFTAGWGDAS